MSVVAVILIVAHTAVASTAMSARVSVSTQKLQRFERSGSLDDLRSAIYAMQSALNVDWLTAQNFVASRQLLVQGWANTLVAIEGSYDPTFDPATKLACPIPPGGNLPPCADPTAISDTAQRSAYAAALAKFHTYLAQNARYQRLDLLDRLAMTSLKMDLDVLRQVAPAGTDPDFAALDGIVRRARVSEARREKVDAMFYPTPHPL